ncbi:MAG TPA: AIR synthase-related protein [Saprospiraceae bacterium]|nr:AIR synthase-related protein [Saprospiraceae bacterium]
MIPETEKYDLRGASSSKTEVHQAIRNLDKGLYPNAFCKILPDVAGSNPDYCNIMHADTAGTKPSLAYIYWKETGDLSVFRGIAQDALVMNLDDMACVGCLDDILISSTIGRNKHLIPGEIIEEIVEGTIAFIDKMGERGISIKHAGGETADTGDIVRTIDVGITAFGRMHRKDLIINQIKPGAVVIGLASDGQANYEDEYNSGIGSNGLTSARHDMLHNSYAQKYPESFSPETDPNLVYNGPWKLTDTVDINGKQIPVGKLLLSPTRTYLPILMPIIREYRQGLQGIIHCTGGAYSKVLKFLSPGVAVHIDSVPPTPVLFEMIRKSSDTSLAEMYKVFNMGIRMLLFVDQKSANTILDLASAFGVKAYIMGQVKRTPDAAKVVINTGDEAEPTVEYK